MFKHTTVIVIMKNLLFEWYTYRNVRTCCLFTATYIIGS